MEFVIDKDMLKAVLDKAAGMVPCQDTSPILKNFAFKVSANVLSVMATDMLVGAIAEHLLKPAPDPNAKTPPAPFPEATDGSTCAPAGKLLELTDAAPAGYIHFKLNVHELTIKGGYDLKAGTSKCEWLLHCMDPNLFPDFPKYDAAAAVICKRDELAEKLDLAVFAAADNELNKNLMAVFVNDGFMYAADGQRACRVKFTSQLKDVMLPAPSVPLLVKILRASAATDAAVFNDKHHYLFKVGGDVYHVHKLPPERKFPDVEGRVFKETDGYQFKLQVKREALLGAIKRAAVTSEESRKLELAMAGDQFSIKTINLIEDRYRETFGSTDVEWNGEDFSRFVNWEHLQSALSVLKEPLIEIRMGEEKALQKTRYRMDEGDMTVVILPLRFKDKKESVHDRIKKRTDAAEAKQALEDPLP